MTPSSVINEKTSPGPASGKPGCMPTQKRCRLQSSSVVCGLDNEDLFVLRLPSGEGWYYLERRGGGLSGGEAPLFKEKGLPNRAGVRLDKGKSSLEERRFIFWSGGGVILFRET